MAAVLVYLSGAPSGATAQQTTTTAEAATGISDADIYNFALNLEYLEASLQSLLTLLPSNKDFRAPAVAL